jgi:uncharacterized protein
MGVARATAILAMALHAGGCSDAPKKSTVAAAKPQRTMSISATASASRDHDLGHLEIEVNETAATVDAATAKTSVKMARIIQGLKDGGVPARDMRTTEVESGLQNSCQTAVDGQRGCTQVGSAENTLFVIVHDRTKLDGLALRAAAESPVRIEWTSNRGFSNPQSSYVEARERALSLVKAKAEHYAATFGVKLGRAMQITNTPMLLPNTNFVYPYGTVPDRPDGDDRPVEPDQFLAAATVYVVYALE